MFQLYLAASTEDTAVEAVQLIDAAVQTVDDGTTLEEAAATTVSTTKEVAVQVVHNNLSSHLAMSQL